MATLTAATAGATPPPQTILVSLSLADSAQNQRWYSRVPSDSPVLLPIAQQSSNGVWNDVTWLPLNKVPLTVDGDADGRVTGLGTHGEGSFGLVWTPMAVREPGRTHTARLADGAASGAPPYTFVYNVYYEESTFEFSYLEATSAEFLPDVELTIADIPTRYTVVGAKCCEVVASECSGAASCHQCWELEGERWVGGAWDGPGIPYLTLSLQLASPDNLSPTTVRNAFQVTDRGEVCIEGTAEASGEARTVTACGTPAAPPVHEPSGVQPVLADSCRVLPPGVHLATALVAVRAETEAQARELLDLQSSPRVTPASEAPTDHGVLPRCAATRGAPPASGALTSFGVLSLLVALARPGRAPR